MYLQLITKWTFNMAQNISTSFYETQEDSNYPVCRSPHMTAHTLQGIQHNTKDVVAVG
jgi:hypothetical protein